MSDFYGEQQRRFQDQFETRPMAERLRELIVSCEIPDEHRDFIQSRDFFFLSTIDHRGFPTCSHKGGSPGFIRVIDSTTLAFPSYDGNGMYLSMGNIVSHPQVGMLFIDFETPHRVRAHGTASIAREDPLLAQFAGAELIVRVAINEIFVNCSRYIHRYTSVAPSKYVPQAECVAPLPEWKRIDIVQDVLPDRDKQRIGDRVITIDEYTQKLLSGDA